MNTAQRAAAMRRAEKRAGVAGAERSSVRKAAEKAAWLRVVHDETDVLRSADRMTGQLRARRAKAIQGAHEHGATYREIGAAMGVSHTRAHLIHQQLQQHPKETIP